LDLYEREAGAAMTLEGIMEAFLRPVLDPSTHRGPGWRHYFALVAQVNSTPVWGGETMTRYFDPVIHRLIALVKRVLPEAADQDLYWSYQMLSGALTLSLGQTGRIDLLSGGLCRSSDLAAACDHLVPFAAAGFRAACSRPR
jgi:Tetracyclin repressor-like, C-terminal domain